MPQTARRKQAARRTEALLREHGRQWHAMIWRIVRDPVAAEELLQELALRQMRRMAEAERLEDAAAYATRVAVNLAFDHLRQRARHDRTQPLATAAALPGGEPAPGERVEQSEMRDRILAAASDLPEETREAFSRHYLGGESYAEIARQMNKTPQQVRGLCHHAVRLLRDRLRGKDAEDA